MKQHRVLGILVVGVRGHAFGISVVVAIGRHLADIAFDIDWRTLFTPCCEPNQPHEKKRIVVNHVCMCVCGNAAQRCNL